VQVDGLKVMKYLSDDYLYAWASMTPVQRDAVALWCVAANLAHLQTTGIEPEPVIETMPRLMLMSSAPGSGKTRVLELVQRVVGARGIVVEPTPAAVQGILGKNKEPLCLDEADVLFGKGARKEAIRAILNNGYSRDGFVPHNRGEETLWIPVWGPVALTALDVLETATGEQMKPLFERSVIIRMRKSRTAVAANKAAMRKQGMALHFAIQHWAEQNKDELAQPFWMPEVVANRDADVWGPLGQVARQVGGDWPERWERCVRELSKSAGKGTQLTSAEDVDSMLDDAFA